MQFILALPSQVRQDHAFRARFIETAACLPLALFLCLAARLLCCRWKVLPFHLMLFLASSMSHVEAAMTQVAYRNAKYLWPGFAGAVRLDFRSCSWKAHMDRVAQVLGEC